MAKSLPQLVVLMPAIGVQVGPHSPTEQHRVLGNGSNAAPHIVQAQAAQVQPIQADHSTIRFYNPEEGDNEGGLAAACASHNAHLLTRCHLKGHSLCRQSEVCISGYASAGDVAVYYAARRLRRGKAHCTEGSQRDGTVTVASHVIGK